MGTHTNDAAAEIVARIDKERELRRKRLNQQRGRSHGGSRET